MTPMERDAVKVTLDSRLSTNAKAGDQAERVINIAFGIGLYNAFHTAGYLDVTHFRNFVDTLGPVPFRTYRGNVVVPNFDIDPDSFMIGLGGFVA